MRRAQLLGYLLRLACSGWPARFISTCFIDVSLLKVWDRSTLNLVYCKKWEITAGQQNIHAFSDYIQLTKVMKIQNTVLSTTFGFCSSLTGVVSPAAFSTSAMFKLLTVLWLYLLTWLLPSQIRLWVKTQTVWYSVSLQNCPRRVETRHSEERINSSSCTS